MKVKTKFNTKLGSRAPGDYQC